MRRCAYTQKALFRLLNQYILETKSRSNDLPRRNQSTDFLPLGLAEATKPLEKGDPLRFGPPTLVQTRPLFTSCRKPIFGRRFPRCDDRSFNLPSCDRVRIIARTGMGQHFCSLSLSIQTALGCRRRRLHESAFVCKKKRGRFDGWICSRCVCFFNKYFCELKVDWQALDQKITAMQTENTSTFSCCIHSHFITIPLLKLLR